MQRRRAAARALVLSALSAALSCGAPPVEWTSEHAVTVASTAVSITADGVVSDDALATLASTLSPPIPACPGSLRLARAGSALFAVWWSPRADSTAVLYSAHTNDAGATWSAAARVDTTDRGDSGCGRTPASIAADPASGYVHVAYAMLAAEGPGVFFAHSMDGGATFHAPVPILYGDRLGRTSVAAAGDLVVVAFDDPNSRTPSVGLAMSRTMGHIFEDRVVPVSDDNGAATHPLVAIRPGVVSIAWQERATPGGGAVLRVRTGTVRR